MIHIYVGRTSYSVPVDRKGNLTEYSYNIAKFINEFREKVWNYRYRYWETVNMHARYSATDGRVQLPYYSLSLFKDYLDKANVEYTTIAVPANDWDTIKLDMQPHAKDRSQSQTEAIKFVVDTTEPMAAITLQTGDGKTYSAIKTISLLGRKTLIIANSLNEQWIRELMNFTTIREREICHIDTRNKLYRLASSKYDHDYKVYLCSTGILSNTVKAEEEMDVQYHLNTILKKFRVGYTIIDEAHLNFASVSNYLLASNVDKTTLLSATLFRTSRDSRKIFNIYFPETIKFSGERKNYLDIYCYWYNLGAIPPNKVGTKRGYNQAMYEQYILSKSIMFDEVVRIIEYCIRTHFSNIKRDGQKCLVFFSRVSFIDCIYKRLKKKFKETMTVFYSGIPESVLMDNDIILSTPGSCGTGTDIKNLRTVICFVSRGSMVENEQIPGRLRQLKEDTPVFVYLSNTGIQSHQIHNTVRKGVYAIQAKHFHECEI